MPGSIKRRDTPWFFLIVCLLTIAGCMPSRLAEQDRLASNPGIDSNRPITRIALGSCAVQDQPQPIWEAILADRPDLFLFLGDNIYADTEDMDTMRVKYGRLATQPGFARLRSTIPVLATWDDHDYGLNDTGAWYPMKEESRQIFLDFFDVPANSPRRQRPGIYGSYMFGPKGRRVQVILLDTRYFRSRFGERKLTEEEEKLGYGPYVPNDSAGATMLGEAQWAWLERQFEVSAEVRIIASSIQVVSMEHGWEIWSYLPHERKRLFDLVARKKAGGVLFVSGDVHWGELSRYSGNPYPLYDLTASALNQSWEEALNLPNRQRVGSTVYPYPNYGTIEIDWDQPDPTIYLRIHDEKGRGVIEHLVRLSELQPPSR